MTRPSVHAATAIRTAFTSGATSSFAPGSGVARSNLEVATLPVLGWLVELEAITAYPKR
jgi:hypothetical protein